MYTNSSRTCRRTNRNKTVFGRAATGRNISQQLSSSPSQRALPFTPHFPDHMVYRRPLQLQAKMPHRINVLSRMIYRDSPAMPGPVRNIWSPGVSLPSIYNRSIHQGRAHDLCAEIKCSPKAGSTPQTCNSLPRSRICRILHVYYTMPVGCGRQPMPPTDDAGLPAGARADLAGQATWQGRFPPAIYRQTRSPRTDGRRAKECTERRRLQ